jgi:hypothetical protein
MDIIISNGDLSNVNSLQDCKLLTTVALKEAVEITSAGVANGALDRVTRKIWLWHHTKSVEVDTNLDKMLKTLQKSLTITTSLVEQFYKDDISSLVITVPDYEDDEDTCKVLVSLIAFAGKIHGCRVENIKILKDFKLGSGKLSISGSNKKLMQDIQASAQNPSGLYAGERYKFQSGFQGNLVDMIAAMRLLNLKSEFIRRRKFAKDSGKTPVSFNTLQESFNTTSGLKSGSDQPYVTRFIKAALSSCIKSHNKNFPGGWIHSARVNNNVKSDFALLNILGWTEKVPSNHKMLEVIFNSVDPIDDSEKPKLKIVNITGDKRNFTHQEFRTAVALTLPRLDTSSPQFNEDQMKLDPLSVKSLTICNNFVKDRRDVLVDSLNESYALRVSLKNPKSKTREVHYKISRERTLGLSANVPLIDSKGVRYTTFKDVPIRTQKFLREKFRYPVKRTSETETQQMEVEQTEQPAADSQPGVPSAKKQKLTRGQARATTRKSGRLASLRSAKK